MDCAHGRSRGRGVVACDGLSLMVANISLWFLAAYIAVFVVFAYRAGEFQWLWGSVLLWLGFWCHRRAPAAGLWGITHLSALYMPHFYIAFGEPVFRNVGRKCLKNICGSAWRRAGFLSLFALSGMLNERGVCAVAGDGVVSFSHRHHTLCIAGAVADVFV